MYKPLATLYYNIGVNSTYLHSFTMQHNSLFKIIVFLSGLQEVIIEAKPSSKLLLSPLGSLFLFSVCVVSYQLQLLLLILLNLKGICMQK